MSWEKVLRSTCVMAVCISAALSCGSNEGDDAGGKSGMGGSGGTTADGGSGVGGTAGTGGSAGAGGTAGTGGSAGTAGMGGNTPVDCSAITAAGWTLCAQSDTSCEAVFEDSAGCDAVCASVGLPCAEVFEDLSGACAPNESLPALGCDPPSGHISDYCVCGTPGAGGSGGIGGAGGSGGEQGTVLAFPTARGAGAYVTGGRGGQVLRVTNLGDSGPGSLRAALTASGPRIITFAVSGTIVLDSKLAVSNGDFTIAGQTAPTGGVTITGGSNILDFDGAENFVVRYVRVRPEYSSYDAVSLKDCSDYIIDHVSVSFGGDEIMTTRGDTDNVTWQRVLLAEGKTGSLFGDSDDPSLSENLSFHHNAYYNVTHRHPNVHTYGRADVYNNVIFNWKYRWSVVIGDVRLNHIGNYYAQGCVGDVNGQNSFNKVFYNPAFVPEIYSAGNLVMPTHLTDPNADNWGLWNWRMDVTSGPYSGAKANTQLTADYQVSAPFPILGPPTTTQPAQEAFHDVTLNVGANARLDENGNVVVEQDALDVKYLSDIRAGECVDYESSSQGQNFDSTPHYAAFRATVSSTPVATGYQDSNEDGIPDAWKVARGVGVSDDLTTYVWPSGYVGIEEFLNEIDQ